MIKERQSKWVKGIGNVPSSHKHLDTDDELFNGKFDEGSNFDQVGGPATDTERNTFENKVV